MRGFALDAVAHDRLGGVGLASTAGVLRHTAAVALAAIEGHRNACAAPVDALAAAVGGEVEDLFQTGVVEHPRHALRRADHAQLAGLVHGLRAADDRRQPDR